MRQGSDDPDELHAEAEAFARKNGFHLVQDGREAAIAEGAGTIAVELLKLAEVFRRHRRATRRRRTVGRHGAVGEGAVPDNARDRRMCNGIAGDGALVAQ